MKEQDDFTYKHKSCEFKRYWHDEQFSSQIAVTIQYNHTYLFSITFFKAVITKTPSQLPSPVYVTTQWNIWAMCIKKSASCKKTKCTLLLQNKNHGNRKCSGKSIHQRIEEKVHASITTMYYPRTFYNQFN